MILSPVVIHDAVNYMLTPNDLIAALVTAYEHLRPGGLVITFAEEWKEHYIQNRVKGFTSEKDGTAITFIENCHDADPDDSVYESVFIYIIRREGKTEIEYDRHVFGIFPLAFWPEALRAAGFEVVETEDLVHTDFGENEDYPMFAGIKPCIGMRNLYKKSILI
nr:hypothetical protein [candidate division Zixibacteria bacterium]